MKKAALVEWELMRSLLDQQRQLLQKLEQVRQEIGSLAGRAWDHANGLKHNKESGCEVCK